MGSAPDLAVLQIVDGRFVDHRWAGGRWVLSNFAKTDGTTNWDAVIDAEMARRKLLEDSPIPSTNDDPVNFDTSEIPWWAWMRRFHLPEARGGRRGWWTGRGGRGRGQCCHVPWDLALA